MKPSKTLLIVAALILVLAALASVLGVVGLGSDTPATAISAVGETITLEGRGLYRHDTPLMAAGFVTQDWTMLLVGLPALALGIILYRRGSFRGGLLLAGALAYVLYDYLSLAFGAAYNPLLLAYIALLALSLIALILALAGFDRATLSARFPKPFPRQWIGVYFLVVGVAFWILWAGMDLGPALASGQMPPVLAHYTTVITYVVDMGLLTPIMVATAVLLFRRSPFGDAAASVLLIFSVLLNVQLAAMSVVQYVQGLMGLAAFIAFSASFNTLALVAVGLMVRMLRVVGAPRPA